MVRDGVYYALGMLLAAIVLAWITTPIWAVFPLALAAFFLWFFRDPERVAPAIDGAIISPADGHVTSISQVNSEGTNRTRISIFLSVFDVHVNRSPIAGTVRAVVYQKGRFKNAMAADCAECNEQNIVTVSDGSQTVIFKQIAGLLARRIVFTKQLGDVVGRGERVGMIKFGSRVDVLLDPAASVQVKIGQKVAGGLTVLAIAPAQVLSSEHSRLQTGQVASQVRR